MSAKGVEVKSIASASWSAGISHLAEFPPYGCGFTTHQHSSRDLRVEQAQGLVRPHPGKYPLGEPRSLGTTFEHCLDLGKEGASRRERGQSTQAGRGFRFSLMRKGQEKGQQK